MKNLIAELIADWSHAPALMIVPGALVAALLKRSTVACHRLGYLHRSRGVDTDPFRARFGERWLGADFGYGPAPLAVGSGLPLIHILLLLPSCDLYRLLWLGLHPNSKSASNKLRTL